ncbi:hypothetical protein GCM10008098_01440 [Rhodanobacter panaciterrae]|uniref:Sulfotransferase family protein n=1 Tax=Rhodanobacter panaciterrae TaxID=490572 RepID=A0ABQ2ZIH7_9GAMM|nr:hypothetical protein [Rhodanobacter panaciterrae]GGY14368.1 hypothetical protein GCM10008098_01440 [Rhodanobacter panaciterrae]
MTAGNSTAILVAGMHRSGTSALTGALNVLGISLGEHLLAPGEDNPKGYWEHQGAVEIHERLLVALERRWDDVRPLPAGWLTSDAAQMALAEISEMVSREFAGAPVWAVKDPRICRFLPLWIEALRTLGIRPVVLFAARRPSEVAASIAARNHWSAPVSEMLWLRHVLEAEAASRMVPRAAVIYDDLLADPADTVSTALARLDIGITRPSAMEQGALAEFVDSADRHHAHRTTEERPTTLAQIADAAYASLTEIAHGVDAWQSLQHCGTRFEAEWQHCGSSIEAVADMAYRFSMNEVAAGIEASRLASDLNAQIRWSEEAVEIRSALQANHDELSAQAQALARERHHLVTELERVTGDAMRVGQELSISEIRVAQVESELSLSQTRVAQVESELSLSQTRVAQVESELSLSQTRVAQVESELSLSQAEASSRAAVIEEMLQSRSWKITRPMRGIARVFRGMAHRR